MVVNNPVNFQTMSLLFLAPCCSQKKQMSVTGVMSSLPVPLSRPRATEAPEGLHSGVEGASHPPVHLHLAHLLPAPACRQTSQFRQFACNHGSTWLSGVRVRTGLQAGTDSAQAGRARHALYARRHLVQGSLAYLRQALLPALFHLVKTKLRLNHTTAHTTTRHTPQGLFGLLGQALKIRVPGRP